MPSGAARRHLRRLWSAEGLSLALGILQGLVVARVLGPHDYGVYALVLTFVGLVYLLLDPRSGDAVIRYVTEFTRRRDSDHAAAMIKLGFLIDACWSLVGLLVVLAVAGPAAGALHISDHVGLVAVAAAGSALAAPLATGRAVLSVFEQFSVISRLQMGVAAARAISIVAVVMGGFGLPGVVWTMTAVSACEGVLFLVVAARTASRRLGRPLWASRVSVLSGRLREIARFLVMSGLTTLAGTSIKQVDTLILGIVASPREAGYYRLAKSMTAPASNVGAPIQTILYPRLASAEAAGDRAGADALVRRTVRRLGLPLAVLCLLSLPAVSPVIVLVAGRDYAPAAWPTIALVVGVGFSLLTLPVRSVFLVRNQVSALLWFTISTSVLCLVVYWPLGSLAGATGMAWGRTGAILLGTVGMVEYLRRTGRRAPRQATTAAPSSALAGDVT